MTGACMICGSADHRLRFESPPYRVLRCNGCGLVSIEPRPQATDLHRVYDDSYFRSPSAQSRGYQDYLGERENYLRTFRRRLDAIQRDLPPPGSALEVGCACGFFLEVLKERGWTALHAVEVSQFAVDAARHALGPAADVRRGYLADHDFGRTFDVVFLWDVIEHMPDPTAELRRLHGLLCPGGRLILETQDVGSLFARITGRRWHMYKFPEHIWHFDRRTLTRLLDLCGFRVLRITKRAAGKYLSGDFLDERIGRYAAPLRWLIAPFRTRLKHLYVNPHDEMIVIAERQAPES